MTEVDGRTNGIHECKIGVMTLLAFNLASAIQQSMTGFQLLQLRDTNSTEKQNIEGPKRSGNQSQKSIWLQQETMIDHSS
ncbi:hypothetical protein PIB30_015909 [Stylosanthes scabra]|uniref:Uncharacterized protein n=1 Tax=Stylosanthes scabra TaxID=79078 RepID=A0ABU6U7F1_9FABA|nr:hypothetical protein [Stylosanthes scabra]